MAQTAMAQNGCSKRKSMSTPEKEPKRLRFGEFVEEKIIVVKEAVGYAHNRSDECCVMLECMVPGSLGPGLDERDELQSEAVEIIGRVMERLEHQAVAQVERAEEILRDPVKARHAMEEEMKAMQVSNDFADKEKRAKQQLVRDAKANMAAAATALRAAVNGKQMAEKEFDDLENEAAEVKKAFEQHFIPVRDGVWASKTDVMKHMAELGPVFKKFKYEESLIAAFQKAGERKPEARGHFDKLTIDEAGQDFVVRLKQLEAQLVALEPGLRKAADNVHDATHHKTAMHEKEKDAIVNLGGLLAEIKQLLWGLFDAKKALEDFPKDAKAQQALCDTSKQRLAEFREGPFAAFKFLRDRVAAASL